MSNLSQDFNSYSKNIRGYQTYEVAEGAVIYRGALISLDSDGLAIPATALASLGHCIGRAETSLNGTEPAGSTVLVARGSFFLNLDGSNPPVQANIDTVVYATSDNEVANTGTCEAGILQALENGGALVLVDEVSANVTGEESSESSGSSNSSSSSSSNSSSSSSSSSSS